MSLFLSGTPEELLNNFLALKSGQDIATVLDVEYNDLIYYIYRIPSSKRYTSFSIKKKKRRIRKIDSPLTSIKILQQKLNKILQAVYKPKSSAHGFIAERNILSNASKHVGKKYVFNIDLEDFFPSINFGRVRGMFMGKPYFLTKKAATILAHLCCFNRQLPQGAPTSPVISNMICAQLDSQLQQLSYKNRCSYTRYADDITFSTTRKSFPVAIATINDLEQVEPGEELNKIIINNGFRINYEKVRLRRPNRRQEVTGLTVNNLPNVKKKYLNQIRAMLHSWEKYGEEKAEADFLSKYNSKHRSPWKGRPSFKYVVKGKIEYLGMVRGKDSFIFSKLNNKLRKLDPELASKSEYPRDLLLKRFEDLCASGDAHQRGYQLETLLKDTMHFYEIKVTESFKRNEGAEQIDGAFEFNNWHYIVECRWREKLADVSQIDTLNGKVERSGHQTMGLFFSINGWSDFVIPTLKQNPRKRIFLMNGSDFNKVLNGEVNLVDLLSEKISKLNTRAEPYYSAEDIIKDRDKG
jgi:RNA-directed DNA polymerase